MLYFNTLPKVLTTDYKNNGIVLTNLLARVDVKESLLRNPLLFYSYDIQEGDTPDIVAAKYYGDPYRYWLVLFSNQLLDPQWDWPLTSQQLELSLNDKYASDAANNSLSVYDYINGSVYEYTKTITTIDSLTGTQTVNVVPVSGDVANSTITGTTTQTFSSGASVTQTVTVQAVSIYQYEVQQNEAKRNINLINSIYASSVESQLKSLMGT
jgi:hypothetical protein